MVRVVLIFIVLIAVMIATPAAGWQANSADTVKVHPTFKVEQTRLLAEARAKILQVFGGAVVMAENPDATVMTGDFIGDGWQDMAVFVRSAPGTEDNLNAPYANCMYENHLRLYLPL